METIISILIFSILFYLIVVPYFKKIKNREFEAKRRFDELKISGLNKANSIHPNIDYLNCIGCGGCVKACPEGDVLGIIDGKATLIHGSKCIGHGLCAKACPIGAITLLMAPPSKSANLPKLDENYETNIKGIFIVGELSGISLIRNAISHSKIAIDFISKERLNGSKEILDLLIIGAGPAGLTSGLVSIEKKLNYLIIEQSEIGGTIFQYPRRKMVLTQPIELPLWGKIPAKEIVKEELLDLWYKIISKFEMKIETNQKLISINKVENYFETKTESKNFKSKNIVLALGKRGSPIKLGVKGESQSKVMYKLIDASTYQNQKVLVVGGGDSAIEAALGLALQKTNDVTISYRKSEFTRLKERNLQKLTDAQKNNELKIIFNSNVEEILEQKVLINQNSKIIEIENDFVFILAGGELPYDLLKKIGVETNIQVLQK